MLPIDVGRSDGSAVVTVNRPEVLNVLDVEHAQALLDRLEELAADSSVRAVVVTGAGARAFSAGADIGQLRDFGPPAARRFADLGHRIAACLESMPKPTVAAVNGIALGGGCELALACDLRVASQSARFGQPEVKIGVIPGWGGTQRLARVTSLGFAKELVLTGRTVDADEALARGLVSSVHPPDELRQRVLELCAAIAEAGPLALASAKEAANLALQGDDRSNLEAEARLFALLFSGHDQREGMTAFIEKRPPTFEGR
jgi:enoyl-CoA hydratase